MDDEQFDKLMQVNKETQEMQAKQGETLNGFGQTLDGLKEENGRQSETLNGLGRDMTKLETNVDHIKERATEDRNSDRQTRIELEGKVREVHVRANDVPKLRGEFENHIDDDHASQASKNKTSIAAHAKDDHARITHETRSDLDDHVIDNNRHSGEAPGSSVVKTGATVAGGVGVGGGVIYGIIEIVKALTAG